MDIKKVWNILLRRHQTGAQETIIVNREQFFQAVWIAQDNANNKELIFTFED